MQAEKQKIVAELFSKGILVTPEIMQRIDSGASLQELLDPSTQKQPSESTEANVQQTYSQPEQSQQLQSAPRTFGKNELPLDEKGRAPLEITFNYEENPKKKTVQDFVEMFNKRFQFISGILRSRPELEGLTSIRRLPDITAQQKRKVSIIGYVIEKNVTKNGHTLLTLEDKTGTIRALISKDKMPLQDVAQELVMDDIIGITGAMPEQSNDIIFINDIVFPDVPFNEIKKAPFPVKAAFTSDIHYGAKMFMHNAFDDFIKWINGETTTGREREEVMQIKYLFIPGDLVEGVGIYPGQENDIDPSMLDVEDQYKRFAEKLKQIRNDIHIIACGGNHDAMRIAEPQPVFYPRYCQALYDLDNFTAISSPGMVTIAKTKDFVGMDVMMYHGYSFPYYFDGVEYLRKKGGINAINVVMEFLMKRRHLAPSHTSTQYVPDNRDDFLTIKRVPDIFASGHVHKSVIANYKHVTMLNCSAWFGETDYMIKRGIIADPARVHIVNLQTRHVEEKNFTREDRS